MSDIALALGNLTSGFNKLSPGAKNAAVGVGLFVAALAPVTIAIGKVITGVGNAIRALSSFSALSALLNPLTLAFAGMAVVVATSIASFNALKSTYSQVSDTMKRVQDNITKEKEQ